MSETVPNGWETALIVHVFKRGDKTQIQNYRPISLLENFHKLFEKCSEMHIRKSMLPLELMQEGFQPQSGTLDQVACIEKNISHYVVEMLRQLFDFNRTSVKIKDKI